MATDKRQLKAYEVAKSLIGTKEIVGPTDNPEVVSFFAESGHAWVKDDETAWCAAFIGACLKRAGLHGTKKLNARSYLDWGMSVPSEKMAVGDVVVFSRGDPNGWQGHVAFAVKWDKKNIWVLGGNQSNSVSIAPYSRSRLLGVRRLMVADAAPEPKPTLWQVILSLFAGGQKWPNQ